MLTPGEFVMSKGAVQQYGLDTMKSMNAAGGGNNIPMVSGGVTYAEGGGEVKNNDESNDRPMKGIILITLVIYLDLIR